MWAIIGGSGFESFEGLTVLEHLNRATPFGKASSGLKRVKIFNQEVLFLPRHGINHELLPQEINNRANIFALKNEGVSKILSISTVGSLRQELVPGDLVIPTQYINRTKLRQHTFCGEGIVGHPSLAHPVSFHLTECVQAIQSQLDYTIHFDKTYVCIEGPAFSTQVESNNYRQMGADIIGMTNFPEYALAREAGIAYLPCCFITDYDCWDDSISHVTLAEVLLLMKANNKKALLLVEKILKNYATILPEGCYDEGLKSALMTPWDQIPDDKKEWLEVLMRSPNSIELVTN